MRKGVLIAVFLGTTALTAANPTPAQAGPVTALIGAATSFFTSVGAAVGFSAVGAATFGTIATNLVVGIGLSAISSLLMPRPELPKPSARMVNYAQPITYQERVYGRVRKGGPFGFTGFKNKYRIYTAIIAAHSTQGPVEHWLDERKVEVDPPTSTGIGGGNVITDPPGIAVGIRPHTGQPGQAADYLLTSNFPEWTAAHDMAGLSYAALRAGRRTGGGFSDSYPTGREPAYNPVWDGNDRIYDPRTATYGFTRNAALILAHELTEYLGREVDWDEVAAEADVCDGVVTNGDGGTQPRWRIDGTISDDMEFEDIRAQMMAACDGWIYERADGKVGFRVGRWIEPTITLTERDFLSLEISEGQDMGAPNEFVVQYPEPQNDWREAPSGAWVHDTAGRRVRDEIAAYMVSSHNQAVRIAKRMARTKRAKYQIAGSLGLIGYELVGHRFVRIEHAELGLSFTAEVGKLTLNGDRISFGLEAQSADVADFAFDAATEEPDRPLYNSVTSSDVIDIPTGLQGTASQSTGGSANIEWAWDAQDDTYTQQFRYRPTTATEWLVVNIPRGQTGYITTGLIDGATYEAQIRNFSGTDGPSGDSPRASAWSPDPAISIVAVANQSPPGALTNFATAENPGLGEVVVSFDAPNDENYYATRIYRAATGTAFGSAALVRTEYGIPSNSDSWTDTGLAIGDYDYWGEPINSSGIGGTVSGPSTVTVT